MSEVYKLVVKSEIEDLESGVLTGIDAVGLVSKPAIEMDWVKWSKTEDKGLNLVTSDRVKFSADSVKMRLTGPLLIPNKMIPREAGVVVYIEQDQIDLAAIKLMKGGFIHNTSHQHQVKLEGNTIVELWTVQDTEIDKAKLFGFDVPVGTLMITVQIGSKQYWDQEIETGNVKGFSIEGIFKWQPVEQKIEAAKVEVEVKKRKKRINLKMVFRKKLVEILNKMKFSETAEIKEADLGSSIILEFDWAGQAIEVDEQFIGINSDTLEPLPAGEYIVKSTDLTTDYTLIIGNEGKLLELKTPWYTKEEEVVVEAEKVEEEKVDEIKASIFEKDATIEELTATISKLKKENVGLNAELKKGVKFSGGADRVIDTKKTVEQEFSMEQFLKERKKKK